MSTAANLYAREALIASGEAVVAGTKVDGRHYLKFTLLNPRPTLDDIADVLDLIAEHAGGTWTRPPTVAPRRSAETGLTTSSPSGSARSTSAWPA